MTGDSDNSLGRHLESDRVRVPMESVRIRHEEPELPYCDPLCEMKRVIDEYRRRAEEEAL